MPACVMFKGISNDILHHPSCALQKDQLSDLLCGSSLIDVFWQTTELMDAWLKKKLAENTMIFGHRVGAIPTNVLQANRDFLV